MEEYDNEFDQYAQGGIVEQPAPEPEHVEPPKAAEAGEKPAWTRGRRGFLSYGDEGPEVDWVNASFGITAASYTKATEEAVLDYNQKAGNYPAKTVGYHTYHRM